MDYGKLFGQRIKTIRKAKKWNQQRLGSKVGIETQYMSLIETGKQQPAFDKITKIAEALEVPINALFLFEREERDEKIIRKKLEALLTKSNREQIDLIYRFAKMLLES